MKHLLTPVAALLCAASSYAGAGTDTFTPDNIEGMTAMQLFTGTATGPETGAKYSLENILDWWSLNFQTANDSFFTVTESPGLIESIYRDGGLDNTPLAVYGSNSPITKDNVASATLLGELNANFRLTIEGDYTYVAIKNTASSGEAYGDSFSFTWKEAGENPPVGGGDGFDHITVANIKTQNPDANYSASSYSDNAAANKTLSYTGASGAVYDFTDFISNGEWWTLGWDYPSPQGYMTTSTSGGYIKSVKFEMAGWVPEYMTFYVSDQPLTADNKYSGHNVTLYRTSGAIPEWTADGVYKYFYLATAQEMIQDLAIEWSEEAPAIPVQTPSISCWSSRIVPGTNVNISTGTQDAVLHVNVYVNDALHTGEGDMTTTTVYEGSNYYFALPGKAGDEVKVEAFATKEGYVDSETAVQTYTLQIPQAQTPQLAEYAWEVVGGQELILTSSTEGATITYTYGVQYSENAADDWTSEPATGASPVTITVPADRVKPGQNFFIRATAIAEGYDRSEEMYNGFQVISDVIDAPTFSLESGTEVLPGATVRINLPANATTIHYVINDGEEQLSTEWAVEIEINEDMNIKAWASGDAPFKDSEVAEANYTVERLAPNQDAITPALFTEDFKASTYATHTAVSENTKIDYTYDGGFWPTSNIPCFYLDGTSDSGAQSILYNTKGCKINRVKLEAGNNYCGFYIMFSDSPITSVSAEMKEYDAIPNRLRIMANASDDRADFGCAEWVDLTTLGEEYGDFSDAAYFAVWPFGQNCYLSRLVVEYDPDLVGVETIGLENDGTCRIFDLNGIEIRNAESLQPGIYVRVEGGKAEKFIRK